MDPRVREDDKLVVREDDRSDIREDDKLISEDGKLKWKLLVRMWVFYFLRLR